MNSPGEAQRASFTEYPRRTDGKAALETSRKYPGTIDLLLSDVAMPRMGGLDLCRKIMRERPGIKVLLMSSDPLTAFKNALPFLQKPFSHTTLRVSIEALLGPIPALR